MSLGMSLSLSHRQTLSLEQRQNLVLGHQLELRCSLLQILRDEEYKPKANCPQCGRNLTAAEIISGFNQDPNDFTTECTGCHYRFQPELICISGESEIILPFYCSTQTTARLAGLEGLTPKEISRKEPALYRASIFHFGSMKAAFNSIGRDYVFDEKLDWENKITPFLGKMPDYVIADCTGATEAEIRKLRRHLKIKAYTKKAEVESLT